MVSAEIIAELISLRDEDERVRAELAREGSLFEGYHPRMEELHNRNAERLAQIIERHGFPVASRFGEAAANAAWLVVQHAISRPGFQRACLVALKEACARGEAPAHQAAYLEDRIRFFEGRQQIYGTQYDWYAGELSPHPIEEEARVNERRASVGLGPIEENTERLRRVAREEREGPPKDPEARRREFEKWARHVGWRP